MSEPFYDREAGMWRHDAPARPKSDAQLQACNFCLAQAAEARAAQASMQHDIQAIITKFQAGHASYIGFVEAVQDLPYFKKDQACQP